MNITLVRPPIQNQALYINPYKLQEVFTFVVKKFSKYNCTVQLIDCQADETIPKIDNNTILFIDTQDGTQDYLASRSFQDFAINSRVCCLLGEVINDGDSQGLLDTINTDNCIFVRDWDLGKIVSIIEEHINLSETTQTHFTEPSTLYGFTDAILHATKIFGDRIHLPGISIGCENKCTFCHLNFRKESSGNVRDVNYCLEFALTEMDPINTGHNWNIQFTDENFFGWTDKSKAVDRLKKIDNLCDVLNKYKNTKRIGIDTRCDTVVNATESPELAKYRDRIWRKFVNAGLDYVYLGVESLAPTQLKRYGKGFSLSNVVEAINYFKEISINFTIGMILFEPMITKKELRENIQFIRKHNLNKNMASLLKEMRYYLNAPYVRMLKNNRMIPPNSSHDFLKYHPIDIKYSNPFIFDNISMAREISNLFRRCGYRHSDIARLMHDDAVGRLLADSHSRIIEMEISIIEKFFFSKSYPLNSRMRVALDIVHSNVNWILTEIYKLDKLHNDPRINYFTSVLEKVTKSINENELLISSSHT